MSLTLDSEPRAGRSAASRSGLLGAGDSNPSGMLEMPVLFRMPDVAELPSSGIAKPSVPAPATNAKAPVDLRADQPTVATAQPTPAANLNEHVPASAAEPNPTPAPARPAMASKSVDKWFDGHTKLLLICFLIALTAVIYLARQKRRSSSPASAPAAPSTEWPAMPPGPDGEVKPLSLLHSESSAPESMSQSEAKTASPLDAAQASNSRPLGDSSATSAPIGDDATLFPWKQSDGSIRAASRPIAGPPAATQPVNVNNIDGPPVVPLVIPPVAAPPTPNSNPRGYQYERTGSGLY